MTDMTNDHKGEILIVDDNTTNLGVLFDYLQEFGFRVLVAQSGNAALKLLEEVKPDIILLDILMPGLDGFETCRLIKENPHTKDIAIIFMTALTESVDKIRGFELGAVDYITKPVDSGEALARIQTHLTLQNLKRRLTIKNRELESVNKSLETIVADKTRQLIQQEKVAIIGRMIQGIAHNLKTPLAVISNSNLVIRKKAERILENMESGVLTEKQLQLLSGIPVDSDLISRAHGQIMDIVQNLMTKSRFDQKIDLTIENINELLRQELDFFQANSQFKHKVKKTVDLDEDIENFEFIYSNLAQVIENLIVNSLHAMWYQENQELLVRSRQDDQFVYLDIGDNGVGIPADKMNLIFDPFYTSKPPKGEEKDGEPTGTGLGLYTCRELLKPFGGRIEFVSTEGKGSTFTVVLPKNQC